MKSDRGGCIRRLVLQERDKRLLTDLFLHRTMSRDQIIALGFFGSVPRANNRLRKLLDHGFVRRHTHSARGSGSQALYRIGRAAAPCVASALDFPLDEVRWHAERDAPALFLEHTLGLVDLRIAFEQGAKQRGLSGFEWLPEPLCRHEYEVRQAGGWVRHVLKPDAFVSWHVSGTALCHFVELDLGNVSQRAFGRKIQQYRKYKELGVFSEVYEAATFSVLTVTTGERRMAALSALTKGHGSPQLLFTTLSAFRKSGPYAPIWTGVSGNALQLGGSL